MILMDLDGVLVDFVNGICKAHGRENPYDKGIGLGEYHLHNIWGVTWDYFAEPMQDPKFWEELDWMPDGRHILKYFEGKEIVFCTDPRRIVGAMVGKMKWLEKHGLGNYEVVFTGAKHALLGVLVDDSDANIRRHPLPAIKVGRPWNKHWAMNGQLIPC